MEKKIIEQPSKCAICGRAFNYKCQIWREGGVAFGILERGTYPCCSEGCKKTYFEKKKKEWGR